ncbi:MAG: hypothetical protein WC711_03225 [Candidatus Staskawiczbacteria bacterium]|jgi:hypothetical protein
MEKELGESPSEDKPDKYEGIDKHQQASITLSSLYLFMENVEKGKINLDNPLLGGAYGYKNQEDALKATVDELKPLLEYIGPEYKKYAEGLIIRAEIYLAHHEGGKDPNKNPPPEQK